MTKTPYERLMANEPPGFRQRPKSSHIWWCFDDQRGCETLNGHEGHDLVRIGPKAPLPEEKEKMALKAMGGPDGTTD